MGYEKVHYDDGWRVHRLRVSCFPGPRGAKCPADSVQVGPICVDKYEASVWSVSDPTKVAALKKLAQGGKATLAALTALGATQHGVSSDDYPCDNNGNDCSTIFAFSIPGGKPSAFITWFQPRLGRRDVCRGRFHSAVGRGRRHQVSLRPLVVLLWGFGPLDFEGWRAA